MVDREPIPGDVAGSIDVWLANPDRLAPGLIEGLCVDAYGFCQTRRTMRNAP